VFRNNQLLRRHLEIVRNDPVADRRPVAVLADPNEAEASLLRSVLERHNFHVLEAREGSVAIDLATRHSARLVIASLDLPRMHGHQLIQELRELQSTEGLPFILITSQGDSPDKLMGHETYASDYIQRPVNLVEFENRLNAVLHARGMNQRPEPPVSVPPPPSRISPNPEQGKRIGIATSPTDAQIPEFDVPPPPKAAESAAPPRNPVLPDPVLEDALLGAELLDRAYLPQEEVREENATIYRESRAFLLNSIYRAEKGEPIEVELGFEIAKLIVELSGVDDGLLFLAMERTTQFSLVQHSINVAIISIPIARELGFQENRVIQLCLAGILHDIGSLKLPKKLLCKVGAYTPSERAEIQRRPLYAAELLSNFPGFEWLPQIVAQVYERENGKGYPSGLKGKAILEEAKVLGLVDVFEACIHHRPQRRAMTGYQSLEILTAEVKTFPQRITKAMLRSLTVYPLNEYVELNTREIGKVIRINKESPLRPIVSVIFSSNGEPVDQPRVLNLAENSSLWVARAITLDELPQVVA